MSGLYVKGKTNLGKSNIDLINDKLIAVLVDTSLYTLDLDNDEVQADIPEAAIISEKTISGQSWDDAIFDADDVIYNNLTSDQEVGAVIIIKYNEDLNLSYLIYMNDSAPEFPIQPDGTNFTVNWANTTNKIFKL